MNTGNRVGIELFRWSAIFVFLGRALQHFLGEHPYRTLFWDENWFGTRGQTIFTDGVLQDLSYGLGAILLTSALVVWLRLSRYYIIPCIGTAILLLMAFLSFKDHFYQVPQLLEHGLQILAFPCFYQLQQSAVIPSKWLVGIKVMLSCTFVAHGIYALNILPTPYHFYEMTSEILGIGDLASRLFLQIAGTLDVFVVVLLWTPKYKWCNFALLYMVVWGGLTALARLVFALPTMDGAIIGIQGATETLYRLCHALMPLGLYYIINRTPK